MPNQRTCGTCTLCCRLVPVKDKDLIKPANQRCQHQSAVGCRIYADRPFSCRMWSCQWLLGADLPQRPDFSHYVVDPMPDFVTVTDDETGEVTQIAAVQIWCDPEHPDAHRDPALRRYIERLWDERGSLIALIRYDNKINGIALFPPQSNSTGKWLEKTSNMTREPEHSLTEILKVIGGEN